MRVRLSKRARGSAQLSPLFAVAAFPRAPGPEYVLPGPEYVLPGPEYVLQVLRVLVESRAAAAAPRLSLAALTGVSICTVVPVKVSVFVRLYQ